MHSLINISNLAARGGGHFIFISFPVGRLKVSPCIWSPLPVLTLPCLCTAFCTWFLLSVSKWVQWGAHGTLPFNILTLFQQEGEQTSSPFHPKLKFVGFRWYHKTKPWIPMLANYNNSAANCMELDCVVQNLTTKYIGDWLHNRTNQPIENCFTVFCGSTRFTDIVLNYP
jgi:hypothetical protein